MSFRVEIGLKRGVHDARGAAVVERAHGFLHVPAVSCVSRDVYKIDGLFDPRAERMIRDTFADPVIARAAIGRLPAPARFDWLIEVGFRPGVTDNLGRTAETVIRDVLGLDRSAFGGVYTGVQYFIRLNRDAALTRTGVERLAEDLVANPLIQTLRVFTPDDWRTAPIDTDLPVVREDAPIHVRSFDLSGSDEDLFRISREGILSLNLAEMHAIRDHFLRPDVRARRKTAGLPAAPTDVEIECLAQTWSEHCKHKIFAAEIRYRDEAGTTSVVDGLFKTFIRGATERIAEDTDILVSVFSDNAGIIRFNDRFHMACKVETHNSPSALDPYGGAITGIVGVNRDLMGTGMGCELVCNTWGYCLGSPFYNGDLPEGLMHPRRIRDGVHHGVIDGGNQSGIPWVRGFERFDDRFIGKPLVYCGTVGRIPIEVGGAPSERKEIRPGDAIVMCGGRVGKDGIHGATFSSEELRQESPAQAVQIGDPITQRMMYEFLVEARDRGLYRAVTDNGAGGLSSSIGELSLLSGGAELDLARAPRKYEGLQPWEILVSEAQERMSLAVPPEQVDAFLALAKRREVEATVLGRFTDSGSFVLRYGDRVVGELDLDFLHEGCPRLRLEAEWKTPVVPAPRRVRVGARNTVLRNLLGAVNVCSREFKSRMYDAEVKGLSVVKPFVGRRSDIPADATVMRVEHGGRDGLAVAEGINPFYSDIDTYDMMASIIDEAVRRLVSAGASVDHMAGLDNFCWPDPVVSASNPDGRYKMAQLVRANRALYDVTTAYRIPCISGKDSMKNDSIRGGRRISIPPTVLFTALGRLDDVRMAMTLSFKQPGDAVYVVGLTRDELGASEYHRLLAREQGTPARTGGAVPQVDTARALALYRAMNEAHRLGVLRSSHTPTLGGLAVAFAFAALGGDLGADLDLTAVPSEEKLDDDRKLFSESNSRFLITCLPERAPEMEAVFSQLPCARIGTVRETGRLRVTGERGAVRLDSALPDLRRAFTRPLARG